MTARNQAPLTEAERARVAANVELVKELMPEMVPIIKELHELGLIEGWRSLTYIGPRRPDPAGPQVVNVGQMVLESVAETKERMGLKNGHH